jgi:enoyl-[acyl-carrier protein] reductase II
MDEGELEIGQVAAQINKVQPAAEIVAEIWNEFLATKKQIELLKV